MHLRRYTGSAVRAGTAMLTVAALDPLSGMPEPKVAQLGCAQPLHLEEVERFH
jgi:hypothetical protein